MARAEVSVPTLFGDGCVLQRGESVPVYGLAAAGEKVSVEFRGKTAEATADKDGAWRVDIAPGEAGGPFQLIIKGGNTIRVKDVFVGDVWVCSGQSNMHMGGIRPGSGAKPEGVIRMFSPPIDGGLHLGSEKNTWKEKGYFSGVGYAFGFELQKQVKVPLGLIYAPQGGSMIILWMPEPAGRPSPRKPREQWDKVPNKCYVEWIKPLQPYRIKGVIWWQGETDSLAWCHYNYYGLFQDMITGWRKAWGQPPSPGSGAPGGDFAFLWVQLQSINDAGRVAISETRDGQRRALALPNTGMAVAFDATNNDILPCKRPADLHPCTRQDQADVIVKRLVLAARAVAYGEKDLVWSGPIYKDAVLKGNELTVNFKHFGDGLVVKGDRELGPFEVQENAAGLKPGDDSDNGYKLPLKCGAFKPVKARLGADKKTVVLEVAGLTPPLRLRYAPGTVPKANLYNSADLPAAPFISDPVEAGK
jgi:sialate O-acetylesterase